MPGNFHLACSCYATATHERHWSDLALYLLGAALFLFTAFFSWRFLDKHAGDAFALIPILGVFGLDVAFVLWALAAVHAAKSKEQSWVAVALAAASFVGVVGTSLSENAGAFIPTAFTPILTMRVYIVILANVLAAVLYHAADPENIAGRKQRMERAKIEARRQQAEHVLERDRLAVEYASRILNQRDSLIQIQEKMANQLTQLDARQREINRVLGGGDLLDLMTGETTVSQSETRNGQSTITAVSQGETSNRTIVPTHTTSRKAKSNGNLNLDPNS